MNERLTLSVAEAAEQLGVCTKVVYSLTHTDGFPVIKLGRRTRISRVGLYEWVRKHEQRRVEA